jgi:hypothetical protein
MIAGRRIPGSARAGSIAGNSGQAKSAKSQFGGLPGS